MKNSVLNSEPHPDEDNDYAVGLQSMLDGSGKQINKGLVNLTGRVKGNGNGSVYVSVHNVRNYYSPPQPLLPSYEQSMREYRSGAKLLKYDQLDNGNTNRILLSKSSPSTPSFSSLSTRCNKRAVICGVTCYGKSQFRSWGISHDVVSMKELLVQKFNFPMEGIRVLTDNLKWLVKDCRPRDSLVFYFSGYDLKQPDDETLRPVDIRKEGIITDNDIYSTIIRPLKERVSHFMLLIIDAAYSGTILDLMYVYKPKDGIWNWEDGQKPITKHTSGGLAICLRACEDSLMAADSRVFGRAGMEGVMTFLFTVTIGVYSGLTYARFLEKMHEELIGKVHQSKYYRLFGKFIFFKYRKVEQDLILSSSEKFDVSTENLHCEHARWSTNNSLIC